MFGVYFGRYSASLILAFGSKALPRVTVMVVVLFGDRIDNICDFRLVHLLPFTAIYHAAARHWIGFCYNAGRLITTIGLFIVGGVASQSANPLRTALQLLFLVGFILLLGILAMPLIIETKNQKLIQ